MKIVHLTNFFPLNTVTPPKFSGSERYVFDMSRRLVQRGHEIHIIYTPVAYRAEHKNLKFIPPEGATMSYFPERFSFLQVYNAVKEHDPDIIHSHNFKMGAVAMVVGMLLKKPVVCSLLLSENEAKGMKRKLLTKLFGQFFKKIHYIAISRDIAESIQADLDNPDVVVIPCWAWNHDEIKKVRGENFRKKFPRDAKITFTISRIDDEKGLNYLFDAAAEIVKKMGIDKNVLLRGRITDEELLEAYKGCDVIVYPSPMDYLFSVSESLATGRPIVATKVKSAVETYVDRENALLVEPRNSKQLEEAILEVLSDKKLAEKIVQGAEKTSESYHPDVCIDRVEKLYGKILQKRKTEK